MHISRLVIKNFRKIDNDGIEIDFNNGINIIIGENNIGKTAIIDALRLALSAGQYRKNIYVTVDDFHFDKYGERAEQINVDVYFEGLTEEQGTSFYLLTDGKDVSKAELHLSYQLQKDSKGNDKIKDYLTGGSGENTKIGDAFNNINLLFLPALRNAEGDLKPSRSSQLAQMLNTIAKDDVDKQRLLAEFIVANEKLRKDPTIKSIEKIINSNLQSIEKEELQQNVVVNLIEPTFEAIAASLDIGYVKEHKYILVPESEFLDMIGALDITITDFKDKHIIRNKDGNLEISLVQMALHHQFDELRKQLKISVINGRIALRQNGLGYNNILSMATSLGDCKRQIDTHLT